MSARNLHPIGDMSAEDILNEFVQDAVRFQATPLQRLVSGLVRVAQLRGFPDADDAYQVLLDRVEATIGVRKLPLTRL